MPSDSHSEKYSKLTETVSDSIKARIFIDQVRLGMLPSCTPTDRALSITEGDYALSYATPEHLLQHSRNSVLHALGLAGTVNQLALKSSKLSCRLCGSFLTRYRTPADLLSAILSDHHLKEITIIAATPKDSLSSAGLNRFAEKVGLSPAIADQHQIKLTLDTISCSSAALMSLSRIISPLFQIPDVIFTSEFKTSEKIGGKSTKSYTVRGWWCDSCLNYYLAPTADTLSKYTQEGSATNMHGAPHLADIEIAPQVSVGELLTLNAANGRRQLQLPQPLAQCYDLMIRVGPGLEGISLGQAVATLSGYELAKLTIVKALLNYRHQESLATLIKLPKGVFSERHEERLREVLEEHASTLRYTDNLFSESSAKPTDSRTIILKGPTSNPQRSEDVSVTLFSSVEERLRGSVVGHTLGILEPLAELFAASINARAQGLKKRDFILFGSRNPPFRCDGCNGLGVVITHDDAIKYPQINCCTECAGARCKGPITIVAFRGMALPDILNAPIKNSAAVLSALPRIKGVLELLGKLNLDHLALGAPCELLSCEEFRLLMIAKELAKLKLKGGELILTIEGMSCGFSNQQLAGLREALHDFGGVF